MNIPIKTPLVPDPYSLDLEELDFSSGRLFESDAWQAYFSRLRDEDPVHFQNESPFGPFWSVTRYEDILYVDKHHEIFSSEPGILIGDFEDEIPLEMFIAMDPPRHDQQRMAVQSVVAPKNLAAMESLIRTRVCKILDDLPLNEEFNWVDKVSIELTSQMLATLFNFPFEDRRKLTYWSDLATGTPELTDGDFTTEERAAGLGDCLETFQKLWMQRLAEDKPDGETGLDLISLMQANDETKDMMDRPMELLGNLVLLIVGGNDTTRNSLTGGVFALNKFPDEFKKLKANPSIIPNMISEIIRWQTPLAHMRRIANHDVTLGGKSIKAGDKVVMWYASGNRDESVFENPNDLIIDRKNARSHLSFGYGIHRCMGNRLAEMQLRIVWEEILNRFSNVEVVSGPVGIKSNFAKGYSYMGVKLSPLS
ncbi:cytochrome P450 [Zhongshania arctica]|uniref:Cytochrome P450 n=1 Tax=Zhongshania arctica TaxID=3238302 RepID=A0ABV3TQU3_9GAMM|tara:strand:+ start:12843 stop:14111 length:1269 start_codon:yes stop_codon:yes gene_type:complete